MLIIAIPKSASTSLMDTLGKLHTTAIQSNFGNNPIPEGCKYLYTQHKDVRELSFKEKEKFKTNNNIYKQHIYPSANNLDKVKGVKKVVLLRDVTDIILAYRRGVNKNAHRFNFESGFSENMTKNEWLLESKEVGLTSDLQFFYEEWKSKGNSTNILIVYYSDLIADPKATINKIEKFFGLQITPGSVSLTKSRYSRRSKHLNTMINVYNSSSQSLRGNTVKILNFLGIRKALIKILRN